MKPEQVYQVISGVGATTIIVNVSGYIGAGVGGLQTPHGTQEDGIPDEVIRGQAMGQLIGSTGSLAMASWLARQPGWRTTGIAQGLSALLVFIVSAASIGTFDRPPHEGGEAGALKVMSAIIPTPLFAMQKARAKQMSYRVQPRSAQIRS